MTKASETLTDMRVSESRKGMIAGMASRIGGAALVFAGGFLSAKLGPVAGLAVAVPGAGAVSCGLRLGLERGAAKERNDQRKKLGGEIVSGVTDTRKIVNEGLFALTATTGPFIETALAGATGIEVGYIGDTHNQFVWPFEASTGSVAVGLAAWIEFTIVNAGKLTEVTPRMHNFLHLS
ncbi:MAG TPA: hypothetical protein VLG47_04560 [Candidatus Saccharimonadales bacterium]|nr:hypothetical protein [Candidatus Saccharimonadales bacterium]